MEGDEGRRGLKGFHTGISFFSLQVLPFTYTLLLAAANIKPAPGVK